MLSAAKKKAAAAAQTQTGVAQRQAAEAAERARRTGAAAHSMQPDAMNQGEKPTSSAKDAGTTTSHDEL